MSPDVKSPTREVVPGFEEPITLQGMDNVAPSDSDGGVFFNTKNPDQLEEARMEYGEIFGATQHVADLIRGRLYEIIQKERVEKFERNAVLLKEANINIHNTEHQDRVAFIVNFLFDTFPHKLDPSYKEVLLGATELHDAQYILAARNFVHEQINSLTVPQGRLLARSFAELEREYQPLLQEREKWFETIQCLDDLEELPLDQIANIWKGKTFPAGIDKKALDPHAELGEQLAYEIMENPLYQDVFESWTEDHKKAFALAILNHSNGSEYNPYTLPKEVQTLRLADKFDNLYERVSVDMLSPKSLEDDAKCHRYVPMAIRDMALHVDHTKEIFTLYYKVDPSIVQDIMTEHTPKFKYNRELFLQDFDQAYRKSMRIAAEVIDGLFAPEGKLYSGTSTFQVCMQFADGSPDEIIPYKRIQYPQVFDAPKES